MGLLSLPSVQLTKCCIYYRYAIYSVSKLALLSSPWSDNTVLLVVCGTVADILAPIFMSYLLNGGQILCLCSDFLHLFLPTFRTAEVRERELVRFSYARWKQVQMMHHIFCYQASPARTRFSPHELQAADGTAPPPQPSTKARYTLFAFQWSTLQEFTNI